MKIPSSPFFFIAFISILVSTVINAQDPVFRHFGTNDGLPSNEIHDIIQDTKGYIYIATDQGVARYNGYEFTHYGVSEGLTDQVIFELQEDDRGRIWFHSFSGQLTYFENGIIHEYPYNSILLDYAKKRTYPPVFFMTSSDSLYVSIRNVVDLLITPDGEVIEHYLTKENKGVQLFSLSKSGVFRVIAKSNRNPRVSFNEEEYPIRTFGKRQNEIKYHWSEDSSLIVADGGQLIEFTKDKKSIIHRLPGVDMITAFTFDQKGRYYVGCYNDGLRVYNSIWCKEKYEIWLKGVHVTGTLIDHEGGLWVTTHYQGVFYLPNPNIKHYPLPNDNSEKQVTALCGTDNGLFMGFKKGGVMEMTNSVPIQWKTWSPNVSDKIYDLYFEDSLLWIAGSKNTRALNAEGKTVYQRTESSKCLVKLDNSSDLFFTGFSTLQFDGKELKKISRQSLRMEHLAVQYDKEKIWGGNVWGLWELRGPGNSKEWMQDTSIKVAVKGLYSWNDLLVIATAGKGLIFRSKNGFSSITKEKGLLSNDIHSIYLTDDQLWLSCSEGLNLIDLQSFDPLEYCIYSFRKNVDLPAFRISAMYAKDSLLWLGTEKGLFSYRTENNKEKNKFPLLLIENFSVNGIKSQELQFPLNHDENDIEISFIGIHYQSSGNLEYRYRLKGLEKDWNYTTLRQVRYSNLSAGEFEFQLQSRVVGNAWDGNTKNLNFIISPPLWQELWFIILLTIILSGLIGLGVYQFVKFRDKKEKQRNLAKLKIFEMEIKALRAQMNPHFTFNTLNSIQSYIWQKDPKTATHYLSRYALLIRKLLESSRSSRIFLSLEIEIITAYLELERLRLDNKFDYNIHIDSSVDAETIKLPPSLIQPFVENAIWHGLSKKKGKGKVVILFSINKPELLLCKIIDNGVGRKVAMKNKMEKNRESLGIKITKDRLLLLSEVEKANYKVEIVDLYSKQGHAVGTEVILEIPIAHKM